MKAFITGNVATMHPGGQAVVKGASKTSGCAPEARTMAKGSNATSTNTKFVPLVLELLGKTCREAETFLRETVECARYNCGAVSTALCTSWMRLTLQGQ